MSNAIFNLSSFTTLSSGPYVPHSALLPAQPPFTQYPPHLRRVPQPAPQNASPQRSPITFDMTCSQTYGLGMPVREIVARGGEGLAQVMIGASDRVGQGMDSGSRKVRLTIVWPGHENANWTHSIELYTPLGPLTRAQLAVLVSQMILSFAEATGHFPPSRCPEWRVGANGISLDRLCLAGLWNTSSDMWMAEILVDTR